MDPVAKGEVVGGVMALAGFALLLAAIIYA
jgi:hypothetical protein